MDGVHSSSSKNIVQGESVGMRPRGKDKDPFGELVGLISFFSCLNSADSWC